MGERETETLDRLYLEWSQFTSAKTRADIVNAGRIAELMRVGRTLMQHISDGTRPNDDTWEAYWKIVNPSPKD